MKDYIFGLYVILMAILAIIQWPLTIISLHADHHILISLLETIEKDPDEVELDEFIPFVKMMTCQTLMVIAIILVVLK